MKQKHPLLLKLGKKIRENRESQGYSQEAFAYEAGLDRAYLGRIERADQNISVLNLMRIAITLNVEAGTLFPSLKEIKKYKS